MKCLFVCVESSLNTNVLGDQFIVVCESGLQVWVHQSDDSENRSSKVNFEIGGTDISGKPSTQNLSRNWKSVWSYK